MKYIKNAVTAEDFLKIQSEDPTLPIIAFCQETRDNYYTNGGKTIEEINDIAGEDIEGTATAETDYVKQINDILG